MAHMKRERNSETAAAIAKSLAIGFLLLAIGYFWGSLTTVTHLFPYPQLRSLAFRTIGTGAPARELKPNPDWPARREQFQLFIPNVDVVMIGDSITQGGDWDDIFPNVKIANRGIGGDRTDDVIRRIDPIIATKAQKALIMLGFNDFRWKKRVGDVFEDYTTIVALLREQGIPVIIQSTLECGKAWCGEILDQIRDLNGRLKRYAALNGITYIDINDSLTTEADGLRAEFTTDGIHLRGNGYVRWSKTIAPYVNGR
jgi:lysophospholipase L1-like esterase